MSVRLSFLLLLLVLPTMTAQDKPLRWGGDKNGGAPFIFEDDGKLTGFEVELAEYLAKELGRKALFVQNQWDNLPSLLKRPDLGRDDDLDLVINGYEYSPERHADSPTSIPYYVFTLRLIGRGDDASVQSWHGLGTANPPKSVGVLKGSSAERYLIARYSDSIRLLPSETVAEMLELVSEGRIDATVQDSPITGYYISQGRFPKLRVVDEPVGTGYYVLLTRPGDDRLRDQLNAAIRKGIRSGFLRELYQKYGLWNAAQQRLSYLADQPWPQVAHELGEEDAAGRPSITVRWSVIFKNLLLAAGMTLLLAFTSFPLAILLGLVVATGRVYGPAWVRIPCIVYVEILRGTPLLLQLFVIFYLLPVIGEKLGLEWLKELLSLPPFVAGVLGLALNYSAAEAENYRAGLQAVPPGQMEAALALGMTWRAAMRRIVLPQAFRIVIPPMTNDFIALFKDTAVCSTILIVELTGLYYQYKSNPNIVVEVALAVAALYLLMSYPLSLLAQLLERRLHPGGKP